MLGNRRLQVVRRRNGAGRIGEGCVRTVADSLEEAPSVVRRMRRHQLVVVRQRHAGSRAVVLDQARAALHVGEEEAEMARLRVGMLHPASIPTDDVGRHRPNIGRPLATTGRGRWPIATPMMDFISDTHRKEAAP